jgi:phosphate transport system permease protein
MRNLIKDQENQTLTVPSLPEQTEPAGSSPKRPTPGLAALTGQRACLRFLFDRLARYAISFGGLAVILSILAIFAFLVLEVLPLFQPPTATRIVQLTLPFPPGEGKPVLLGLDEHQEVAYAIISDRIVFLELPSGRSIPVELPPVLQGKRITAAAKSAGSSARHILGTEDGLIIPITVTIATEFSETGARAKHPFVSVAAPMKIAASPIIALAYRSGDAGVGIAAALQSGRLLFIRPAPESEEATAPVISLAVELATPSGHITALALDESLHNLYAGTDAGSLYHFSLAATDQPVLTGSYSATEARTPITGLGFLIADRSLVVMTAGGAVSTWVQVRDSVHPGQWALRNNHKFEPHPAAVTAFSPSQRDKGFITGDAVGNTYVEYATSGRTLLRLPGSGAPVLALTLAPKANGILVYDAAGALTFYTLHNPHPEVTLATLFGKVWYEGYDGPAHVWQSSSGSDDFEAKFGLTPLAFGTLKGTIYALLLAIPLAILSAIFTSQFMHPDLRAKIKPTIEVMAALPTVVLGFLAGLWLASLLERIFPAVVGAAIVLPCLIAAASFLWHRCPRSIRNRFPHGSEAFLLIPLIAAGTAACLLANDGIEQVLFQGDFKAWLSETFGLQYDQRNAVVVGIVMGIAVIPIIYSIAEEALSNVPQNLIAGSLALGATRWQTVAHMVLWAASPGIFSAVMIGFGRAIGETMIVLMATGNTPIMDWSMFNGFRTLSANIAVEIPEAPHGGTLYRVLFLAALLLFVVTFAINTAAELVRHRLRKQAS